MVRIAFIIIFLIATLCAFPAHGARQARPVTGIGLLVIRPASIENTGGNDFIAVYEDIGVKRIAEVKAMDLPGLIPTMGVSVGEYTTVVTDKKGEWLKIAYDDADREGWIEMKRSWEYLPWRDFLKDRHAALLPKLREADYMLHAECSDISEPIANVPKHSDFQVIEVLGDWVKVRTVSAATGCLRWRGGDGRFMISLGQNGL